MNNTMSEFYSDLFMQFPYSSTTYGLTLQWDPIYFPFSIDKVIYHDPATIILWKDGTKTVVKCDEHDAYDPEKGLYIALLKKVGGNRGKFYKEVIEPWLPKKKGMNESHS